jgi:hypothetical protein
MKREKWIELHFSPSLFLPGAFVERVAFGERVN